VSRLAERASLPIEEGREKGGGAGPRGDKVPEKKKIPKHKKERIRCRPPQQHETENGEDKSQPRKAGGDRAANSASHDPPKTVTVGPDYGGPGRPDPVAKKKVPGEPHAGRKVEKRSRDQKADSSRGLVRAA